MPRCLLALGSNLGDRLAILDQTCAELASLPRCQLLSRSSWHGTAPIGGSSGQGEFLNGAALLETSQPAHGLAKLLQAIEAKLGRERIVRWDARTIDIDLLLYGTEVIDSESLTVPHPRMAFRNFVLEPAAEIAGAMLHPTSGWTIASLLIHVHTAPRYVVVTSAEKPLAEWLVAALCERMNSSRLPSNDEKKAEGGVSQPSAGIEFPDAVGQPPVVAILSPQELAGVGAGLSGMGLSGGVRPALVISLDAADTSQLRLQAESVGFAANAESSGWQRSSDWSNQRQGPIASITADDPATVLQEAQAALRCIWPDVS